MLFALGYIAGLLTATLIVATLAFFKKVIEHKVEVVQKQIEAVGPRPRGYIIEPEDESNEARAAIIARNREAGRDTHISELQ